MEQEQEQLNALDILQNLRSMLLLKRDWSDKDWAIYWFYQSVIGHVIGYHDRVSTIDIVLAAHNCLADKAEPRRRLDAARLVED